MKLAVEEAPKGTFRLKCDARKSPFPIMSWSRPESAWQGLSALETPSQLHWLMTLCGWRCPLTARAPCLRGPRRESGPLASQGVDGRSDTGWLERYGRRSGWVSLVRAKNEIAVFGGNHDGLYANSFDATTGVPRWRFFTGRLGVN